MPDLASAGPAGAQRASALQWDPYPLDDVGPPVVGGRPQEYARPIPEVKRGQAFTPKRPELQPLPWFSPGPSAGAPQPVFQPQPAPPLPSRPSVRAPY